MRSRYSCQVRYRDRLWRQNLAVLERTGDGAGGFLLGHWFCGCSDGRNLLNIQKGKNGYLIPVDSILSTPGGLR